MKKFLLIMVVLTTSTGRASLAPNEIDPATIIIINNPFTDPAEPEPPHKDNYCSYGGSINGAVRFEFTKIGNAINPRFVHYESRLSEKLIIIVSKIQGHSALYSLVAHYDNGLVTMRSEYVDFAPLRKLNIHGSVEGKGLDCQFNPETF